MFKFRTHFIAPMDLSTKSVFFIYILYGKQCLKVARASFFSSNQSDWGIVQLSRIL